MILFAILTVFIAAVTYIWSARGFYSSLLNMLVTICSATIALGLWEPTAYLIMDQVSDQWILDGAWGLALVVPFLLIQMLLTLLVNFLLKANVTITSTANYIGGAVCGVISAFLCAGILFQSASMLRSKADAIGDAMVVREANGGSPVRTSGMLLPYDRWFGGLANKLSTTTFSTSTPLALWRPQFADEPHLLRMSPNDLFLKYTYKPNDSKLRGRYTVGRGKQIAIRELVGDTKTVRNIDGSDAAADSYVEGYVVQFSAGAREQAGQVVVGPGMFTLIMLNRRTDEVVTVQPFAMISQAKGDDLEMGRWRFDTPDLYVASAGAGADPVMAFEFLLPQDDFVPIALYVRGIRHVLLDESVEPAKAIVAGNEFAAVGEYATWYSNGGIAEITGGSTTITTDGAGKIDTKRTEVNDLPIKATNSIGDRFNRSFLDGLELDGKKQIVNGIATLAPDAIMGIGSDRSLIVENFAPGDGSIIVRVDAGPKSRWFIRGDKSEGATGAPKLQDDKGQIYECVGFYYKRNNDLRIRFTPGQPIKEKTELPSISKTDDTIRFTLIFRVSLGVTITKYLVGNTLIDELEPGLKYDAPQTPR